MVVTLNPQLFSNKQKTALTGTFVFVTLLKKAVFAVSTSKAQVILVFGIEHKGFPKGFLKF